MAQRIGNQPLTCVVRGRDQYGRMVALCHAGGEDLSRWMVERGFALYQRRYGRAYMAAERQARAAGVGIWQGKFVLPWEWRKAG